MKCSLSRYQTLLVFILFILNLPTHLRAWDDQPAVDALLFAETPHHILKNESLDVVVFLPDDEKGFYRGRRFEGGLVGRVTTPGGRVFIGSPKSPGGASMGICSEFIQLIPLNPEGSHVLRVGQGAFKAEGKGPWKDRDFQRDQLAPWIIETSAQSVTMKQAYGESPGHAYHLEKHIVLDPSQPKLQVSWTLKNTGTLPLNTRHYSHNWLGLNGKTISTDLELHLPFDFMPHVSEFSGRNGFRMRPRGLVFEPVEKLNPGSASFLGTVLMEERKTDENQAWLRDRATGSSVWIVNDWSPFSIAIYVDSKGYCPESFITIELNPGEQRQWSSVYRFMEADAAPPDWWSAVGEPK